MNSKERVLTTIRHEEPDRVPLGEWGIDHDHVSKIIGRPTYWRNRKESQLAYWAGKRDEVVEGLKQDMAAFVEALDYDIVMVELVPPKGFAPADPPQPAGEGLWKDSAGNEFRYAASNDSIICMTTAPAREALEDADIENFIKRGDNIDRSTYELVQFAVERFGKDRAIVFRGPNLFESILGLFGGDHGHMYLMTLMAPDDIKRAGEALLYYWKKHMDIAAEMGVDIYMCGQDFGSTQGCIVSPDSIRQLFIPLLRQFSEEAQKRGMIPFTHCCGNVWDILDDLADAGIQGYQSVQASASMDWKKVKERVGDRMTIWAGLNCETLVSGTAEEAEAEAGQALKDLMPGGGFILGSTNSVQFGAKTENYLRGLQVLRTEGLYRGRG